MTNEKKRYRVIIFGQEYTLVSSEQEEQILEAARLVDTTMQEIAGKSAIDQNKIAVLVALHMAINRVQAGVVAAQQMKRHQALVASIDELCL
jgi:cell division protein ZapA (FtsZ GTPase activity inhibitor)